MPQRNRLYPTLFSVRRGLALKRFSAFVPSPGPKASILSAGSVRASAYYPLEKLRGVQVSTRRVRMLMRRSQDLSLPGPRCSRGPVKGPRSCLPEFSESRREILCSSMRAGPAFVGVQGTYAGKHRANALISLGEPLMRIFRVTNAHRRLFSLARKSIHVRESAVTCKSARPTWPS